MPRKNPGDKIPRLYSDLAEWFHLLTAPEDYRQSQEFYRRVLTENSRIQVTDMLEMGSGGGNTASHMKNHFNLTLTDLSEDMLTISRKINPECEHLQGDMRDLRLGRQFDAVFIQDAISYINTEADLLKAIETAFVHCKPGGAVLLGPDYLRETFRPSTRHGGHDSGSRGLRYLEWTWDPEPADTSYFVDFAYLLKIDGVTTCEYERHVMGLFSESIWRRLMQQAGFTSVETVSYPEDISWPTPLLFGIRPE